MNFKFLKEIRQETAQSQIASTSCSLPKYALDSSEMRQVKVSPLRLSFVRYFILFSRLHVAAMFFLFLSSFFSLSLRQVQIMGPKGNLYQRSWPPCSWHFRSYHIVNFFVDLFTQHGFWSVSQVNFGCTALAEGSFYRHIYQDLIFPLDRNFTYTLTEQIKPDDYEQARR